MRINGVNGSRADMPLNMPGENDPRSKEIKSQIQKKQEELQKLSEESNMPPDMKMKKRQELQREIAALNIELRQHQMEQRNAQKNNKDEIDKDSSYYEKSRHN